MTQITDLLPSTTFGDGDITLIRKSGALNDTSITYSNLLKSLGNPAISGFNAVSEAANKLTLTAVNLAPIDTYFNGMRVSFISSINSNGAVQIKIGNLVYKDLFQYGTTETSIFEANKYYEAIYIGDNNTGKFFQTNILTPTIYTNEYTSVGVVAGDEQTTTLTLTSAIGMAKTSYYTGMSLLFTNDVDSKGVVSVNVDGLGLKVLRDKLTDLISNDLFIGQTILATYDGTQFIKQKFGNIEETPDIPVEPPVVINPIVPPVDPWDPNYAGDPDDPAGAISPDSVDSQGRRFFENTVLTVGNGGRYDSLAVAITDLLKNFGQDGGGKRYAIVIKSSFDQTKLASTMFSSNEDLSWISIFAENNNLLTFTGDPQKQFNAVFGLQCKLSPILNFKFRITGNRGDAPTSPFYLFASDATLITGRNCQITYDVTNNSPSTTYLVRTPSTGDKFNWEAKFGLTINSNYPIMQSLSGVLLFNKANFIYNGTSGFIFDLGGGGSADNGVRSLTMYNSIITFTNQNNNSDYGFVRINSGNQGNGKVLMRNVTNTARSSTMIGIIAKSWCSVVLDNCNFRGTGANTPNGYDIMVDGGTPQNSIQLLNGTTGALNQAEGVGTTKGLISRVL